MTYPELVALLDARLGSDRRLEGSGHEGNSDVSLWSLNAQSVAFRPSGSTGILAEYASAGHVVHSRIFAASPLIVERIANTAAEHLTAYALHRL